MPAGRHGDRGVCAAMRSVSPEGLRMFGGRAGVGRSATARARTRRSSRRRRVATAPWHGTCSDAGMSRRRRARDQSTGLLQAAAWPGALSAMVCGLWAGSATLSASAEHGLSQKPLEVARLFGFPITNSMIVTWIVAAALILFVQAGTRRMQPVPRGAQNLLEWLVEGLYQFLERLLGPSLVRRTFWFFASVFIF